MFENDTDRKTCEDSWAESLELMLEAGFDFDALVKENDLQARLVDQEVEAAIVGGESIPF